MSELDAAIRQWVTEGSEYEDLPTSWAKVTGALLATLDLHQPCDAEQIEPGGGAIWGKACVECGSGSIGSWPCPTVRAIAEKLGVEVDDAHPA